MSKVTITKDSVSYNYEGGYHNLDVSVGTEEVTMIYYKKDDILKFEKVDGNFDLEINASYNLTFVGGIEENKKFSSIFECYQYIKEYFSYHKEI